MMYPRLVEVTDSFTRPADTTAYADNDIAANSTTAGSVEPLTFVLPKGPSGSYRIRGARLSKSGATNTNANFTLILYTSSPTCANGDNGAFSTTLSGHFGTVVLDMTTLAFSDDSGVQKDLADPAHVTTQTIYGLLKVEAAYTPANAEVFTCTLIAEYY